MQADYSFILNLACAGPTADAIGHPVGGIPLDGNFPRSQLGNELKAYFKSYFMPCQATGHYYYVLNIKLSKFLDNKEAPAMYSRRQSPGNICSQRNESAKYNTGKTAKIFSPPRLTVQVIDGITEYKTLHCSPREPSRQLLPTPSTI